MNYTIPNLNTKRGEFMVKPTKKELAYYESFSLGLIKKQYVNWVIISKVNQWNRREIK